MHLIVLITIWLSSKLSNYVNNFISFKNPKAIVGIKLSKIKNVNISTVKLILSFVKIKHTSVKYFSL